MIEHLAASILENFDATVPVVVVSDSLRIERLDKVSDPRWDGFYANVRHVEWVPLELRRDRLWSWTPEEFRPAPREHEFFVALWSASYEDEQQVLNGFRTPEGQFDALVTALRLLDDRDVGRHNTLHHITDTAKPEREPEQSMTPGPDPLTRTMSMFHRTPRYTLDASLSPGLGRVFSAVTAAEHPAIRVTLSRLDRQYPRHDALDQILDAVIAFEALYLPGTRDELSFRLATRVAVHQGVGDPDRRAAIFDLISTAYKLRSGIAHGDAIDTFWSKAIRDTRWQTHSDLRAELTQVLRASLLSVLLDVGEEQFRKSFHADLDRALIRGHGKAPTSGHGRMVRRTAHNLP